MVGIASMPSNEILPLARDHVAGQERRTRLSAIDGSLPASDTGVAIGPDEVRIPV